MKLNPLPQPICNGCGKKPEELACYNPADLGFDGSATEYVRQEEGTYNPMNGHFLCDTCYIKEGQPVGRKGTRWTAP